MIKIKNIIEESLKYESDKTRLEKLLSVRDEAIRPFAEPSEDEIMESGYNQDGVFVFNRGKGYQFYEYWFDSCWEGLRMKRGYGRLDKESAMQKFVDQRFSKIAKEAGMKILDYNYIDNGAGDEEAWMESDPDVLIINLEEINNNTIQESFKKSNNIQLQKYINMAFDDSNFQKSVYNYSSECNKIKDGIESEDWIEQLKSGLNIDMLEDIKYFKLPITEEEENGLIDMSNEQTLEFFNLFDHTLKERQEYPYPILDLIDYETGEVFICKAII